MNSLVPGFSVNPEHQKRETADRDHEHRGQALDLLWMAVDIRKAGLNVADVISDWKALANHLSTEKAKG